MDDEWISAAEALATIARARPPGVAADAIWNRAHGGLLRARAKRLVDGEGREHSNDNCTVPDWFWVRETIRDENWATGDFEVQLNEELDIAQAFGVEFLRADIAVMLPANAKTSIETAETQPSGRRQSELWPAWIAEIVAHIHESGVPEGVGSQGQEELISAVADALAKRGQRTLGRTTVQSTVQAVLDRLRSTED